MAEIDYAFVADFAKVEPSTGTLTTVGASYTFVTVAQFPVAHRMAVAGRVRAPIDEGDVALKVVFTGPDDTFTLEANGTLHPGPGARPYGQERLLGHLFAIDLQLPLPKPGLYWVEVSVAGNDVTRRLAFEAQRAEG